MRIVVCIKQVPGTNQVHLDPDTRTIIREARHAVINPYDAFAIELAVQLKEQTGAGTIALSMGIPATENLLRDALCRGIDQAVLLTDRVFAGADTWATASTLAMAVRKIGAVDLILCGKMAIDGDTAQTGPELAECLNFVPVTDVTGILSISHGHLIVRHNIDGGYRDLAVELPALLTVAKDSCVPRMPSIRNIRDSADKPLWIWHAADLGADPEQTGKNGSPTRVIQTFTPEITKTCQTIDGDTSEQVRALRQLIGASLP
jgi:electron transfer flavoprotein beta subunit